MARQRTREQLKVTVPGHFRCPISMDVMKSPVSLSTGVTYDRSSIEKWLSLGHTTCPATMQSLNSTNTTPNLTLRRLIQLWLSHSDFIVPSPLDFEVVSIESLSKLISFMRVSEGNLKFVAVSGDVVEKLVAVFAETDDVQMQELIVEALELILTEVKVRDKLCKLILSNSLFFMSLVNVLQKGSVESKVKCAKMMEQVALNDDESKARIGENKALLHELYKLCNVENDLLLVTSGLSVLTTVSSSRQVKKDLIRFGLVKIVGKILTNYENSNHAVIIEKAVQVLESVATCTEGRSAISENKECVVGIVKRLMKCSRVATEHGITVLWSVCCLARDSVAQENVVRVNGLTKILLVMQSECSTSARMMCGELVKVLRVKNGKSNLAPFYETKTIHITPC